MKNLANYCKKHSYELLEEYTTLGEKRSHRRAKVKCIQTGEIYHLYYDPSRILKQKSHSVRGWRNTTLDGKLSRAAKAARGPVQTNSQLFVLAPFKSRHLDF